MRRLRYSEATQMPAPLFASRVPGSRWVAKFAVRRPTWAVVLRTYAPETLTAVSVRDFHIHRPIKPVKGTPHPNTKVESNKEESPIRGKIIRIRLRAEGNSRGVLAGGDCSRLSASATW